MVIRPRVKGLRLSKALVDGGSPCNILFYDTFKRMKLPDSMIKVTPIPSYGIIPYSPANSLGRAKLRVTIGDSRNLCKKRIIFEVVNSKSAYHCVMGGTALAKFQAEMHPHLNMMIIQGRYGPLRIFGNEDQALACVRAGHEASPDARNIEEGEDPLPIEPKEAPTQPALKKVKIEKASPEKYESIKKGDLIGDNIAK